MATIIASVALSLSVVLIIACMYLYKQYTKSKLLLNTLEKQVQLHGQSISGLTAGALGVDRRLRTLQDSERELSQRQDTIETHNLPDMPYEQAIRLVQQGADASTLMSDLGMSESEASLIQQLHGSNSS